MKSSKEQLCPARMFVLAMTIALGLFFLTLPAEAQFTCGDTQTPGSA